MAFSQKPIDQDCDPLATLFGVIWSIITEQSTLQLSDLHVLDIAVNYIQNTALPSSDWLRRASSGLIITPPGDKIGPLPVNVNSWVLLHLDTHLSSQRYILPEEVKELTWSDTPEKVHIARAWLVLYDSLEKAEHEGTQGLKPDPELLSIFLWSNDHCVCTHAFKWCLNLVPIIQPGTLADADSTKMFIPEIMGYKWVEHLIHVLCMGNAWDMCGSWSFLLSHLVPKWTLLTPSWCHDFTSAFLFSIVRSGRCPGIPAYQCLFVGATIMPFEQPSAFLLFLTTMLELIKSSLTWARLTSLEDWLADLQGEIENWDAQTQIEHILAIRKQQLAEEALWIFAELPMAGPYMGE